MVAYTHIDEAKTSHEYWYARWNGQQWQTSVIAPAGHAFHQNWDKTERCYSGGMAIDTDDTKQLYLSMPVVAHASQRGSSLTIADNPSVAHFDRDGVYEIWHYTLADDGSVSNKEQVTRGSAKGNARPYVIPGSANSKMRLTWMQGDYYYWMVNKWYPKGYPTAIVCDVPMLAEFDKQTSLQSIDIPLGDVREPLVLTPGKPVRLTLHPDTANYARVLFTATLADGQRSMVNGQWSILNCLDIGTGSGCIAVTLAAELPGAQVTACDISEEALKVARENAHRHHVQLSFAQVDILSIAPSLWRGLGEAFTLIVSNPPYICHCEAAAMDANVLDHEPHTALFVPDDDPLLFYRAIATFGQQMLQPDGWLYFEINPIYANDLRELLHIMSYHDIEIKEDQFGKQRFIRAQR